MTASQIGTDMQSYHLIEKSEVVCYPCSLRKKTWNILTFRDEVLRGAQKDQIIKQTSFERKKEIKNLNYNDQILVVNSVTLGQTAKDNNSFTQGLLRYKINQRLHKTGFRCASLMVLVYCSPHFQCQNEEKFAQAARSFFTLKTCWKRNSRWLQLVFHFGTENQKEKL